MQTPPTVASSLRLVSLISVTLLAARPAPAQWFDDAAPYDRYGSAVAVGDFDGDGVADLAVGIPGEDLGTAYDAGAVRVHYSSAGIGPNNGPGAKQNQYLNEPILGDAARSFEYFGSSLAVGDFNADPYDDLAIGAYGEDVGILNQAGAVYVVYGGPGGLDVTSSQRLYQGVFPNTGNAGTGDWFGKSLVSADFDLDGAFDLAVGVPRDDSTALVTDSGVVNVFYGQVGVGLAFSTQQQFWEERNLPAGASEQGDQFGYALAAGDFNGDFFPDLAIGVPFEDAAGWPSSATDMGRVYFLEGWFDGLQRPAGQALSSPLSPGLFVTSSLSNARFGSALAAGERELLEPYFLAVGAPNQSVGSVPFAGRVHVFLGDNSSGWTWSRQEWDQDSPGIAGGAEPYDAFGSSVAFGNLQGAPCLAIGVPAEALGSPLPRTGVVHVLYHDAVSGALGSNGSELWHQGSPGVPESTEPYDTFGTALAFGDVSGEGIDDLIVGVPGESIGGYPSAGAVHVLFGGGLGGLEGVTTLGTLLIHEFVWTFTGGGFGF